MDVYCTSPSPSGSFQQKEYKVSKERLDAISTLFPKPSTFSAEENRSLTFGFTKLSFLRFSLNPTLPPFSYPLPPCYYLSFACVSSGALAMCPKALAERQILSLDE